MVVHFPPKTFCGSGAGVDWQVFSLKGDFVLFLLLFFFPGEYEEAGIKIAHKGVTLITHQSE